MLPSTTTKPRSSTLTPAASSPTFSTARPPPDRHHDLRRLRGAPRRSWLRTQPRCRRSRRTCTPVCTLMPRFVNARCTVCATCWSTPARICGSDFEERDLGAHVDEERRELAADRTAADHGARARALRRAVKHMVGRQHLVAVEVETRRRQRTRPRSGRDDDVARRGSRCRRRPGSCAPSGCEHAGAGNDRDLAALEQ